MQFSTPELKLLSVIKLLNPHLVAFIFKDSLSVQRIKSSISFVFAIESELFES